MNNIIALATGNTFSLVSKSVLHGMVIVLSGEEVKYNGEKYPVHRAGNFRSACRVDSLLNKVFENPLSEYETKDSRLTMTPCDKLSIFMKKRENHPEEESCFLKKKSEN